MINRRKASVTSSELLYSSSSADEATSSEPTFSSSRKRKNKKLQHEHPHPRKLQWFGVLFLMSSVVVGVKKWSSMYHHSLEHKLLEPPQQEQEQRGVGVGPHAIDQVVHLNAVMERNQTLHNDGIQDKSKPLGQHPLRMLLIKAGYSLDKNNEPDQQYLPKLPDWQDIVDKYGSEPRIIGLDTCEKFQALPDPQEHMIGVAGTFNSGTNLLSQLLWDNCYIVQRVQTHGRTSRGIRWQVPYGKHSPVNNETYRRTHKAGNEASLSADQVLPVVIIRDPYYWMSSMCRHSYQMVWPRSAHRCPNLVPDDSDPPMLHKIHSIPVHVKYGDTERLQKSMVHHYNEWYGAYLNAKWPRVIVRYEDLVFRPRKVIEQVCQCAGGRLVGGMDQDLKKIENGGNLSDVKQAKAPLWLGGDDDGVDDAQQPTVPFFYTKESAKDNSPIHGKQKTSLIQAMIQFYDDKHNRHNMTQPDLAFAQKRLDPALLHLFHYRIIPP